jgi:hypothetical protein
LLFFFETAPFDNYIKQIYSTKQANFSVDMVGTKFDKDPIFEYPVDDRLAKRLKVSPTISAKALRNAIRSHFSLELSPSLDLDSLIERYVLLLQGQDIPEKLKENAPSTKESSTRQHKDIDSRPTRASIAGEFGPRTPLSVSQPKAATTRDRKSDIGFSKTNYQIPSYARDDTSSKIQQNAVVEEPRVSSRTAPRSLPKSHSTESSTVTVSPVVMGTSILDSSRTEQYAPEYVGRPQAESPSRTTLFLLLGAVAVAVLAITVNISSAPALLSIAASSESSSTSSSALVSAAAPVSSEPKIYVTKIAAAVPNAKTSSNARALPESVEAEPKPAPPVAQPEPARAAPAAAPIAAAPLPVAKPAAAPAVPTLPVALPAAAPVVAPAAAPAAAAASSAVSLPPSPPQKEMLAILSAAAAQMAAAIADILAAAAARAAAACGEAAAPLLRRLQEPGAWSYVLRLDQPGRSGLPALAPAAAA